MRQATYTVFAWALVASLAAFARPVLARQNKPARVPMALAKVQVVEAACRRVYGDAPAAVQACREAVTPRFVALVPRSPFCPREGALAERLPACVNAVVAAMVLEAARVDGGNQGYDPWAVGGANGLQRACGEAWLCGSRL